MVEPNIFPQNIDNIFIKSRKYRLSKACILFFSTALVVIDTDGSAFITKAEFDSLKNNFQSQIDQYNLSIDNKIDGAIAAYLSGVKVSKNVSSLIARAPAFTSSWTLPELTGSTYISYANCINAFQGCWDNSDTNPYNLKLCHNELPGQQANLLSYCTSGTLGNVLMVNEDFFDTASFNDKLVGGLSPLSAWQNEFQSTYYGFFTYRESQGTLPRMVKPSVDAISLCDAASVGLTEFGAKTYDYTFKMKDDNGDRRFYYSTSQNTQPTSVKTIARGTWQEATVTISVIYGIKSTTVNADSIGYLSGAKLPTDDIKVVSVSHTNLMDTTTPLIVWASNTAGNVSLQSTNERYYGYGQKNFTTKPDKLKNSITSGITGETCYYYSGAPLFRSESNAEINVRLTLNNKTITGGAVTSATTKFGVSSKFDDVDLDLQTGLCQLSYGGSTVPTITANANQTVEFSFNAEAGKVYYIKALPSNDTVSFDAIITSST